MDTQQVRGYSDAWLTLNETLHTIEERKRTFAPGTREFFALAQQVEELVKIVFDLSQRQSRASAVGLATGTAQEPVNDVEPPRSVPQILEAWRDAERRLSMAPPDSPDFIVALREAEMLRAEYKEASGKLDGG